MNLNSSNSNTNECSYPENNAAQNYNNNHDNNHDSNANKIGNAKSLPAAAATATMNNSEQDQCIESVVHQSSKNNNNNVSKTRETVQKVYRLLERTRNTSTSSSKEEQDELNDNVNVSSRNGSRKNSQQTTQQSRPPVRSSNNGSPAKSSQHSRNSRNSQSPGGSCSSNSNSSSNRQSPSEQHNSLSNHGQDQEDGPVNEEESQLAKLRCPSLSTEAVSEREQRRRKRMCSDYPGLAFGLGAGSVFGSDTMMKFSLIKNELHNVINGQLKRAENEVATFNRRIQLIEDDLEKSKTELGSVTNELGEVVSSVSTSGTATESGASVDTKDVEEENDEDLLDSETKTQVRLISEESNKVYNEVVRRLIIMEKELETLQEREEQNEMTIIAELRRQEMQQVHGSCPNGGTAADNCDESEESHPHREISQKRGQKLDHAVVEDLVGGEKDTQKQKLIAD